MRFGMQVELAVVSGHNFDIPGIKEVSIGVG